MKKILFVLSTLLLLFSLQDPAAAEDFSLDDKAVFYGMNGMSWYQGYTPTEQYNTYTLCLPIRSDTANGEITATLTLEDPDSLLFRSSPLSVSVSPQNGIYPVRISVPLLQTRRNGDYPATISLSGQTADGRQILQNFPYTIRIRGGCQNPESLRPEVSLSGQLQVGETSQLTVTIFNPSSTLSMTQPELTLTDPSADVLMAGSDRLALSEILPGRTAEVSVPVTVKGTAKVEVHSLSLKLSYQVLEEGQVWEEVISCPVTQEIRLEPGTISLPSAVSQGDVATVTVPLMNMGKGDLCNALVTLEFSDLIPRQSVLVGTIEPGATGQAKLTLSPGNADPGEYTGTIEVSCEDRYGNLKTLSIPAQITVEQARAIADTAPGVQTASTPSWLLPALAMGCLFLAAALILQGAMLRARLHKLEEERL